MVYGLIVLPVAGVLLLVSAALAVAFSLRRHGHRWFMITMLALNIALALGLLFAGTYM